MSKVILLTGTSSGFGRLAAPLIASKGHRVYATMREIGGRNAAIARELGSQPGLTVLELDLGDRRSNECAVEEIIKREDRLDVVINNPGAFHLGIGESFTDEDLMHIYNVDVLGP